MRIVEYIVRLLMWLLSLLPLKLHYVLSVILAWIAERLLHYRIHDVTVNLARSFPDKDYSELREIRHRFYRHFGEIIAESVWFGGTRPRRLHRSRIVEIENSAELASLYETSPGVMVLMSHAGNWELIGGMASYVYNGEPVCFTEQNFVVVYRRQSSSMWDRILRDNRRAPLIDRKGFRGYVESGDIMRYAFEHKGEKKIYNFITDQYPYFESPSHIKVDFMHQETVAMKGAAALACKFGMAVCFLSMRQEGRGHYKVKFVPVCTDASAKSPEWVTREYYRLLQADIEAQPWNYLWSHRRWKQFYQIN